MVIGWEKGNESMEGPAILAYSAGLSPLVCRLFLSPLFVLELLITSLSPLRCIPYSFVILPRKQIREPSLSHHTFPLSHSAFLCLCPLAVQSAPHCVSTLHFDPPLRPMMSHREQGLLGSDPRSNVLVSSEHFCRLKGCRKLLILPFQESASLVWRKCLLFQEVCPALLKSFKVAPRFPIFLPR